MAFYPASVNYEKAASKDAHHKTTYEVAVFIACRYQEKSQLVKDSEGKEVQSSAWIQFPPNTVINYGDRLTLPSGKSSKIVLIDPIRDHMNRLVNVDVYLGKT